MSDTDDREFSDKLAVQRFKEYDQHRRIIARDLTGEHIGAVVQFRSPVLPSGAVTTDQPLQFDVLITGRVTTVGHAREQVAIGVDLDGTNTFQFVVHPYEPVEEMTPPMPF